MLLKAATIIPRDERVARLLSGATALSRSGYLPERIDSLAQPGSILTVHPATLSRGIAIDVKPRGKRISHLVRRDSYIDECSSASSWRNFKLTREWLKWIV